MKESKDLYFALLCIVFFFFLLLLKNIMKIWEMDTGPLVKKEWNIVKLHIKDAMEGNVQ